jgi:hypothetical protein
MFQGQWNNGMERGLLAGLTDTNPMSSDLYSPDLLHSLQNKASEAHQMQSV